MLVLSRQRNESVVIKVGEVVIEMTVVDIRGDKVRLGFTAPKEVPIHRREVYEAILRHGELRTKEEPQSADTKEPAV